MENAENKGSAFVHTYSAQKNSETEMKGQAVSIALGVIGSLLLRIGMCCTMVWNFGIGMMIVGKRSLKEIKSWKRKILLH